LPPVDFEPFQQNGRESDIAGNAALGDTNVDHHALAVKIADLEIP
jgi:hypothetical protein